jgi:hypothetical protein
MPANIEYSTKALRASYVRAFHETANTKNLSNLRFCVFVPGHNMILKQNPSSGDGLWVILKEIQAEPPVPEPLSILTAPLKRKTPLC